MARQFCLDWTAPHLQENEGCAGITQATGEAIDPAYSLTKLRELCKEPLVVGKLKRLRSGA